jgi:hypothetical protein
MNPQAAGELVHLWLVAHEDPGAVAAQRGPVSRAVRELAPDTDQVGIGHTPTGPVMLVRLDKALLVLQSGPPAAAGDGTTPVKARLLQLDPALCELEVTERVEQREEGQTLVHGWQLRASGLELTIVGCEGPQPGGGAGHDANETLARRIASTLGWVLP